MHGAAFIQEIVQIVHLFGIPEVNCPSRSDDFHGAIDLVVAQNVIRPALSHCQVDSSQEKVVGKVGGLFDSVDFLHD